MNDPGVPAQANRGLIPPFAAGWLPLRSRRVHLLCLTLLSLSVYAATLAYGFVWDDHLLIVENKTIRQWSTAPLVLASDFFQNQPREKRGYHRPLITLSYMVDCALWGLRPFGYHVTNLLFHTVSALLVYLIALWLFGDGLVPFVASALFAVHPIHTESVAWISGRTDVIAATFLLLSFLLYVKSRPYLSWGALVAFVLALLAKEVAFVLPALVLLYESLFDSPPWRERLRRALPFLVLLGLYLPLRFGVLGISPANPYLLEHGRYRLFLTFLEAVWIYTGKLLLPVNLSAYYSMPVAASPFQTTVLLSLLALAATGTILWWIRRKEPAMVLSLLFVVIALLPVSNLMPLGAPKDMGFFMAERFLYLPSVGFSLFLALLLSKARQRSRHQPGRVLVGLVTLLLISFYSTATVARNRVWRDELTFYRKTLQQAPFASVLHYNLGVEYKNLGLLDLAEKEYREVLRINPFLSDAHNIALS